jgi:hypothetical protein
MVDSDDARISCTIQARRKYGLLASSLRPQKTSAMFFSNRTNSDGLVASFKNSSKFEYSAFAECDTCAGSRSGYSSKTGVCPVGFSSSAYALRMSFAMVLEKVGLTGHRRRRAVRSPGTAFLLLLFFA